VGLAEVVVLVGVAVGLAAVVVLVGVAAGLDAVVVLVGVAAGLDAVVVLVGVVAGLDAVVVLVGVAAGLAAVVVLVGVAAGVIVSVSELVSAVAPPWRAASAKVTLGSPPVGMVTPSVPFLCPSGRSLSGTGWPSTVAESVLSLTTKLSWALAPAAAVSVSCPSMLALKKTIFATPEPTWTWGETTLFGSWVWTSRR